MHKELKLYAIGSEFKILSFYHVMKRSCGFGPAGLSAYLIESIEDENIMWVFNYEFNSQKCNLDNVAYDSDVFEQSVFKNFTPLHVPEILIHIEPYTLNDEIYAVSKK